MRAKEFIDESKTGKISNRYQQASRGLHKFSDADRWNADYTLYRLGMAVAGTDGKVVPEMDTESWVGKSKVTAPYSKEEQDMLKIAYKIAGANYEDLNHGDLESQELKSTNTTSPVANWMKKK
jgi:hypothetical protein